MDTQKIGDAENRITITSMFYRPNDPRILCFMKTLFTTIIVMMLIVI